MKGRLAAVLLLVLVACDRKKDSAIAPPSPVSQSAPLSPWEWHPIGGLAVIEGEVAEPTQLVLEGRSIRESRYAEPGPVRWEFFRPPDGEQAVLRTEDGRELARFTFAPALPPPTPGPSRFARSAEPPQAAPEPPSHTHTETRPEKPSVQTIPDRRNPALPSAGVAPVLPAWTRTDTRPQNSPVPPIPDRWNASIPSAGVAPTELPPAPSGLDSKTRTEARLKSTPISPIPDRRPLSWPSASSAPGDIPRRPSTIGPLLVDPVVPRPSQPAPAPTPSGATALWPGMGEASNLTRGPSGRKRILLSFDGGSNAAVAAEVLDLLKARGVRTTLFLTGHFIRHFPALVKRMAAEGHELGNHTMNHPHFAPAMKRDPAWTRERVQRELLDADAALVALIGRPMDPFWRAPFGEHTAEIRRWAEELGYRHVGWSEGADTLDWATPKERRLYRSGEAIVQRLQTRLGRDGDGLIVLMHLGSERSSADRPTNGLGAFMDRARKEGWSFVSAGTFLQDLGKPAWDSHRRLALLDGAATQSR